MLGLAGAVDIYNDLKDPFGTFGKAYQNLYGWVPSRFKKTNCYGSVYHSLRTGYIEKIIKNGKPYLRLTSKGNEKLKRDFSLFLWQDKKWDGKWRVVIFDIKEKERKQRDTLRAKLRELGFGMIQESVWLSPHDVALDFHEYIDNIGLKEDVFIMEVSQLLGGNSKVLAAKIWSLEKINNRYRDLYEHLTFTHDRVKDSKVGAEEELNKVLNKAREGFIEILREDPCLPKELLPKDWYGEKVKRLV